MWTLQASVIALLLTAIESASLWTATVLMPSLWQVFITRHAISPRFAIRILSNICNNSKQCSWNNTTIPNNTLRHFVTGSVQKNAHATPFQHHWHISLISMEVSYPCAIQRSCWYVDTKPRILPASRFEGFFLYHQINKKESQRN